MIVCFRCVCRVKFRRFLGHLAKAEHADGQAHQQALLGYGQRNPLRDHRGHQHSRITVRRIYTRGDRR